MSCSNLQSLFKASFNPNKLHTMLTMLRVQSDLRPKSLLKGTLNFQRYYRPNWRGAVVEWLEQLDYRAESCREVMSSRLGFAIR